MIIEQSKKRIEKLKNLCDFFGNTDLFSIFVKTETIHSLFEKNKDLEENKLELFHVQYTDSLISLLDKIKKKTESDILTISSEINVNNESMRSFDNKRDFTFDTERKFYSGNFSEFMRNVYQDLSKDTLNSDWDKSVLTFYRKYSNEFYRTIDNDEPLKIIGKPSYKHGEYTIERKLIGRLNQNNFNCRFLCGYKRETEEYELFRIVGTDTHFIFNIESKILSIIDNTILTDFDITNNVSEKELIVKKLYNRNLTLQENLRDKNRLSQNTLSVINDYLKKLESMDITGDIFNIDEETNILRSMLNLNINK